MSEVDLQFVGPQHFLLTKKSPILLAFHLDCILFYFKFTVTLTSKAEQQNWACGEELLYFQHSQCIDHGSEMGYLTV